MVEIRVTGAEKFENVARALRIEANGDLQRELNKAVMRSTVPLRVAAKKSARANLPRRGGLNAKVAGARFTAKPRGNGARITADGIEQLPATNRGHVRHPVYGNKRAWVNQAIPKARNWFSDPMRDGADTVRRELLKALDRVADKIARF
jgi:hypothetical protein